jgi:hypothetical protein
MRNIDTGQITASTTPPKTPTNATSSIASILDLEYMITKVMVMTQCTIKYTNAKNQ